ncbi:Uma2 family endonuclease [Pontibacter sp. G13]|uniref:Uma2 family endonuclease n=1 Tax=Pontibacter sp. G13 TaxID=3074898 RepID=UPI00288B3309|nr:Uma2 family endonuclease [Pontibacter sp. G13]WNJ17305.1 Uma2 family endonuclease [Pontibacter sp. G13]
MGDPIVRVQQPFSYADYLKWEGDERWELIDGEARALAAPTPDHQRVLRRLSFLFEQHLQDRRCEAFFAPIDVVFGSKLEPDNKKRNVVQPDLIVVCDPKKITRRGCEGTPDLVVEILSPATMKRDMNEKFRLYERQGVKEYWVVSIGDRSIITFIQGAQETLDQAGIYSPADQIPVHVLDGFELDLATVFPTVKE